MKTKKWVLFLVISLFALTLIACQNEGDKKYNLNGFIFTEGMYNIKTANQNENFDFNDVIETSEKITWFVSYDEAGENKVLNNTCQLQLGNNFFYIIFHFSDDTSEIITVNVYRRHLYKVHYNTNCQIEIASIEVEEDSLISAPEVELVKQGYRFSGWLYNFKSPIVKDITIEAKWLENSYQVNYDPNGGEIEYDYVLVTYGYEYDLDIPIRQGYEFIGWAYNNVIINSPKWNIAQDITIVAQWEKEETTYEIDYVIVGAIGSNLVRSYSNRQGLVLKTPYKCGYKFIGWYYEGNFSGERIYEIPVGTEGDIRLYSKWEIFKLEGAEVSFLGDSISTFYSSSSTINSYYTETNQFYYPIYSSTVKTVDQTWWYKFLMQTKTKMLVNDSYSGSSCYNNGSEISVSPAMNISRIANLGKPDIVIVYIGTNDNVNGFSDTQFQNAYNTMIERIKKQCPDAFIFCCLMGYSNYHNTPSHYNYSEARRISYNTIVRTVAYNNDCSIIDFSIVQTADNYNLYLGDNLHPNANGMEALAQKAIIEVKNYLGAV